MFERRLKLFLLILSGVTVALAVRAVQVQVFQRDRWVKAAAETMRRSHFVDTVRGSLLDRIAPRWASGEHTVAVLNPPGQGVRQRDPVLAVRHRND